MGVSVGTENDAITEYMYLKIFISMYVHEYMYLKIFICMYVHKELEIIVVRIFRGSQVQAECSSQGGLRSICHLSFFLNASRL